MVATLGMQDNEGRPPIGALTIANKLDPVGAAQGGVSWLGRWVMQRIAMGRLGRPTTGEQASCAQATTCSGPALVGVMRPGPWALVPGLAIGRWWGPPLLCLVPLSAGAWFPVACKPVGGPSFMIYKKVEDVAVGVANGVANSMGVALVVSYPALLHAAVARSQAVKPVDEAPFLRCHWVSRVGGLGAEGLPSWYRRGRRGFRGLCVNASRSRISLGQGACRRGCGLGFGCAFAAAVTGPDWLKVGRRVRLRWLSFGWRERLRRFHKAGRGLVALLGALLAIGVGWIYCVRASLRW